MSARCPLPIGVNKSTMRHERLSFFPEQGLIFPQEKEVLNGQMIRDPELLLEYGR